MPSQVRSRQTWLGLMIYSKVKRALDAIAKAKGGESAR